MIMKKRIGELSEKIILQNVYYRKHLGMLERYAEKNLIILINLNVLYRSSSCESVYLGRNERQFSTTKVSDVETETIGLIDQVKVKC